MGKTPGKWIKSLLRKKSSKSNPSKKDDIFKLSSNKDVLVPSVLSVSDLTVESSLISSPTSGSIAAIAVFSEKEVVSVSSTDNVILSNGDEVANAKSVVNLGSQDNLEKIKFKEPAIKAQAAFRGYLACRSLRTLKSIIRLQALIRGHLVRRQAVSTLCCVKGIVKFQALARGYKLRSSDIGLAVHRLCKATKSSSSIGVTTSAQAKKHSESVFIHKLLATSSSVVPLYINYDPGEPNFTWNWLDCWTRSHFWAPLPESKRELESVSDEKNGNCETIEDNKSHLRGNAHKVSGVKIQNSSMPASNKDKRHSKEVLSRPLHSGQENSQKKVKKNIKTPVRSVSDRLKVSNEKRKHSVQKTASHTIINVAEQGQSASSEKMKDLTLSQSKQSDQEDLGQQAEDEHDNQEKGIQGINEDLNSSDNCTTNMKPKNSQRRASLPANFDSPENEDHNTQRLPSYMASTESAKARLRGQGTLVLASDLAEKNGETRRRSLSSSFNRKSGLFSPRAEQPVALSSREMIQTDGSLFSSRVGTYKLIQPRWRR